MTLHKVAWLAVAGFVVYLVANQPLQAASLVHSGSQGIIAFYAGTALFITALRK